MEAPKIIVFTGPTILPNECKDFLQALYLPPAQCGDILSITRLNPDIIILIDGNFETCASVWHKEILYAIHMGIIVYGASSLGALRAAELDAFGMRGHGKIYEWFSSSRINDDDEVALLHGPENFNYIQATIPLVNIRATVDTMIKQNVSSVECGNEFIQRCKDIFYQDRTEISLYSNIFNNDYSNQFNAIKNYIEKNGYENQKKADAQDLLRIVNKLAVNLPRSRKEKREFNHTIFFNKLLFDVMCRPLRTYHKDLPTNEINLINYKTLPAFNLLIRLAKTLPFCYALLFPEKYSDATGDYKLDFSTSRTKHFINLLEKRTKDDGMNQNSIIKFTKYLFMLFGQYHLEGKQILRDAYIKSYLVNNENARLFITMSKCWFVIDTFCNEQCISPSPERVMRLSDDVRKYRELNSKQEMNDWLIYHNISEKDWFNLVLSYDRLTFLSDNFPNILKERRFRSYNIIFWLEDALNLSY